MAPSVGNSADAARKSACATSLGNSGAVSKAVTEPRVSKR
jgi:hypothetical protein